MQTLREYIKQSEREKIAIGHFNFSTMEMFNAIVESAKELNVPVIAGVSEGERDFIGIRNAVALVREAREKDGIPIFINADHTYSFERVKEAIDAGFDAVIFDGVKLSAEENLEITKKCADYAREVEKNTGREILVEAELGYIGKSSKILDEIPEGAGAVKTTPEEAKDFVEKTGVDLLAPSVGNIHGLLKTGNPDLDIELISKIRKETGVPLVLHGGSGISDEGFQKAIEAGISMVHISTEMRKAYREGIEKSLEIGDAVAPYKYLELPKEDVKRVVTERMKLFAKIA